MSRGGLLSAKLVVSQVIYMLKQILEAWYIVSQGTINPNYSTGKLFHSSIAFHAEIKQQSPFHIFQEIDSY